MAVVASLNYYLIQYYQSDQVNAYVDNLAPHLQGIYNSSGRAYPDISAVYNRYPIYYQRKFKTVGGTSASTPVVALSRC